MAGVRAILAALLRLSWREISSDYSISGNNLLLILFLLLQGGLEAAGFPLVLLGGLVLAAMSTHPLSRVPSARLASWPLTRRDRVLLRILGFWLNPAALIVLPLLAVPAVRELAVVLLSCVVLLQLAAGLASTRSRRGNRSRLRLRIPAVPGRIGELVRKDLRQLLSYLDPWVSFVLCGGGVIYRFSAASPDPEAGLILSSLAAVIMGTTAQCLFGLDGPAGFTRYRLLPLRGWQVLAAKGCAWLMLLGLQTALLEPAVGVSAGLVALGVGHHRSVRRPAPQKRWRFSNGSLLMLGLVQTAASIGAGVGVGRAAQETRPAAIAACLAFYALSLAFYGRVWDRRAD